jgi:hypothetical protein
MSTKADFNAEEWERLTEAPILSALQVAAAQRGGTIRESLAVGRTYADARKHSGESPLLDAIVASPPGLGAEHLREMQGELKSHAITSRTEALAILDGKGAPEEIAAYKQFILTVSEAAAEANREGGFLGIGGKPVSEAEQAALDEIRTSLRT